ncbi:MAG: DUF2190 family protein [Edaphocola sp.]
MQNLVSTGKSIDTVLDATVSGGDVVVLGNMVGVAVSDGDGENLRTVALSGVYTLPKGTGAITLGAKVYYDATNAVATTTASGNTLMGLAFAAAASADTTVTVGLTNGF